MSSNTLARFWIFLKSPWKAPFQQHRCVVPLPEFREPCYWGETAGSEVYFKATDADYLGVASLYSVWKSPDGEELVTMPFQQLASKPTRLIS